MAHPSTTCAPPRPPGGAWQAFVRMFGGMKLVYTSTAFAIDTAITTAFPGAAELRPMPYQCSRCLGAAEKTDDCVECV